ncbi:MAG TPA: Gfo/Idh/MocA family oxidoreductase [Planctomycetota bacterium]|nr:Gfo/Idh/MocA family oxidoreductase [Planctomycetota bacterium]
MAQSGGFGFGIVGLGTIAEFHARAIQAMSGGHLLAAFSRKGGERADKFAADFGVKVHTGDFDAFLKTPGLDIVTIATPSGAHLEPVLAAAKQKKHILCEKPLEITLERCDQMIAACKKNRVKLAGIFQSRSQGGVKAIKAALDAGRFGRLTVVNALVPWWRTQAYYDSGGWRGTWELDGGGSLMNQSIHQVDILQYFGGPIAEVSAYAACLAHKRIEVEDTAAAAVRFKNGALGLLLGSTSMFPGDATEIHVSGDKGSARLRAGHLVSWQFEHEQPQDVQIRAEWGPPADDKGKSGAADPKAISFTGHQRQFENFVQGLEGREKLLVEGPEARKAVELILAVYQSALSNKAAKLPLKKTPRLSKFPKK